MRGPQRADLAAKVTGLERLLDEHHHLVEVERLVDVVVRTALHRLDGVLDGRERGHEDDERLRRPLLDAFEHAQPVVVRQLEVEQNQIDAGRGLLDGSGGGVGFENVVALLLQTLLQGPPEQRFVVDDQQRGVGHLCSISGEE